MSYHMKASEILKITVKTVWTLDENWVKYQRIASKILSMLKLLLEAIASNSNVQSLANRN